MTISNTLQIEENKKIVKETGRTQFVKHRFALAFSSLNPKDIELAAKYAIANESGMIASMTDTSWLESPPSTEPAASLD